MKKQYVIPVIKMQEVCLRSCIMSGEIPPSPSADGPGGPTPMPVAARRLYA